MLSVISATRSSESEFWNSSALGISLRRLANDERLIPCIAFENQRGLPEVYNTRINASDSQELLLFVHDDVWIDDYFLADRISEGLQHFDVLGVAGNRRRLENQPAWAFANVQFTWDQRVYLSGAVAHGQQPFGPVSYFGPAPQECELLDGVFLAARKSVLVNNGVQFDPRFDFHFYDLDFCRTARQQGLRLATWPICLTHQSGGGFGSPSWQAQHRVYIDKWGS
jgi:GT2 family glycosyltransferase